MTGSIELILPKDYDDYGWDVEDKGVFWGAYVDVDGRRTQVTFYDPIRLMQDIAIESDQGRTFFASKVIVVAEVTRENMEAAIKEIGPELFPGED